MSERSELFFQKKSNSHTASPPAQPEVWEPKPNGRLGIFSSKGFPQFAFEEFASAVFRQLIDKLDVFRNFETCQLGSGMFKQRLSTFRVAVTYNDNRADGRSEERRVGKEWRTGSVA